MHPPPIFIPDMECPVALAVAAVAVAVIIDSMSKEIREFFPFLLDDFSLSFYLNSRVKASCKTVSGKDIKKKSRTRKTRSDKKGGLGV